MADSDWARYVGMATGLFGAVMGYVGYRRSDQIKALDLRLELRKGLASAHESLVTLRDLLDSAATSRMTTLAARGLGRSGASVAWEQALTADRAEIDRLAPAAFVTPRLPDIRSPESMKSIKPNRSQTNLITLSTVKSMRAAQYQEHPKTQDLSRTAHHPLVSAIEP